MSHAIKEYYDAKAEHEWNRLFRTPTTDWST